MTKHRKHPKVRQALELDGSEEALKTFYANWAQNYDKDTTSLQYSACRSSSPSEPSRFRRSSMTA